MNTALRISISALLAFAVTYLLTLVTAPFLGLTYAGPVALCVGLVAGFMLYAGLQKAQGIEMRLGLRQMIVPAVAFSVVAAFAGLLADRQVRLQRTAEFRQDLAGLLTSEEAILSETESLSASTRKAMLENEGTGDARSQISELAARVASSRERLDILERMYASVAPPRQALRIEALRSRLSLLDASLTSLREAGR